MVTIVPLLAAVVAVPTWVICPNAFCAEKILAVKMTNAANRRKDANVEPIGDLKDGLSDFFIRLLKLKLEFSIDVALHTLPVGIPEGDVMCSDRIKGRSA